MASNAKIIGDLIAADSSVAIPGDGVILASDLADGSVTTAKLADANVSADKLASTLDLSSKTVSLNSPTISGNTAFDTDTLYVDATNNNVGIGTSSPSVKLHVKDSAYSYLRLDGSIDHGGIVQFQGADDVINARIMSYSTTSGSAKNNLMFYTNTSTNSGIVERMRIDYNGKVYIGCTSAPSASVHGIQFCPVLTSDFSKSSAGSSGDIRHIGFYNTNGFVGGINTNGSGTTYNTSSDYRLKENVSPMSNNIDRLKQLNPVNFAWKVDGSRVDGFLAHEAAEVVPEAVTGEKDAMRTEEYEVTPAVLDDDGNVVTEAVMGTREVPDYQGIDQSKLVPLLTAALQEAIAEIDDLKARMQALENQ